jgi:opacity protein-like surface antigen
MILGALASAGAFAEEAPWPLVVSVSGGLVLASPGDTQTLNLTSSITNSYVAEPKADSALGVELFAGLRRKVSGVGEVQYGLALANVSPFTTSGVIWEEADPTFDNYAYSYDLSQTRIALKGRTVLDFTFLGVRPFVSASLGLGFNRAESFAAVPTIDGAAAISGFQPNSMTSFTYTLGLGAEYSIDPRWRVGLGIEFGDLGKFSLGSVAGQTTDERLKIDHVYTRGALLSVSFVLGGE